MYVYYLYYIVIQSVLIKQPVLFITAKVGILFEICKLFSVFLCYFGAIVHTNTEPSPLLP